MTGQRVFTSWTGQVVWSAALALVLTGCGGLSRPRPRLGAIPYPGLVNLFELCDPADLGQHHYDLIGPEGAEHGILYTRRAGFLDISHVRDSIDLTYYFQVNLEKHLLADRTRVVLATNVPSRLHLDLHYPDFWQTLDEGEKARVAHELAIVMAQRLTYVLGIWHEAITWMGYKSTIIIPEDRSAFTYEDTMSHMIGIMVAGIALRDTEHSYDEAVTIALRQVLDDLEPVPVATAEEAIRLVEGKWWKDGTSLKRYLDVGLDDEAIEPWLVSELSGSDDLVPTTYRLQTMNDVAGRDFSGFYEAGIEPRELEASWLKRVFKPRPRPRVLSVQTHLPLVVAQIRQEMAATMGPDFDNPSVYLTQK